MSKPDYIIKNATDIIFFKLWSNGHSTSYDSIMVKRVKSSAVGLARCIKCLEPIAFDNRDREAFSGRASYSQCKAL